MNMALQVVILVVAIVVAVAGIGAALALRMSARQRERAALRRAAAAAVLPAHATSAAVIPLSRVRAAQQAAKLVAARRAAATAGLHKPANQATRSAEPALAGGLDADSAPVPLDPATAAHKAKLDALQAMLALGDARAAREAGAQAGRSGFADTQTLDDADAPNPPTLPLSLLNLDRAQPSRRGSSGSGR